MTYRLTRLCFRARLCGLGLFVCAPLFALDSVTLVLSDNGGIYQEAAVALQDQLTQAGVKVTLASSAQRRLGNASQHEDMIVALGALALRDVLSEHATPPVLSVLIPRVSWLAAVDGTSRQVSALYLDQPPSRMAALQRIALPESREVGVLLGPSLRGLKPELDDAASRLHLKLQVRTIATVDEVFPALSELTATVGVLWLLPDPLIVNRNTLASLFLESYRQRCPVLAYSEGLVQTGAMLGLYASPAQLGREAGAWLKTILQDRNRPLPPPRFPSSFTVSVNRSVATSFNLNLPSVDELSRRLSAADAP